MSRARAVIGVLLACTCAVLGAFAYRALAGSELAFDMAGERYELLAPELLAALALLPLLLFGAAGSLTDLPPAQRGLSLLVRALLIATLALGLARPARTHDATRVSAVVLADVSESVTDADLAASRELVRQALAARGDGDLRVVTFAGRPRVVPLPDDGSAPALERHVVSPDDRTAAVPPRTDIQSALQLAYGLFEPGRLKRVLLLSDGLETHGDALAEAARAERLGVRVFHHLLEQGSPDEVAVKSLELPERIAVGESFELTAELFASQPARARLRLYQDQVLNGLDGVRDVELESGTNTVKFKSIVRAAGEVSYRLIVEPAGADRFAENNQTTVTAIVPGRPVVLVVDSEPQHTTQLARALQVADFDVEVRSPSALPRSLAELGRYDLFVLSDVPADRIGLESMDAIERYVRDLGGGLLMLGGAQSYGLGGHGGTRMEQLLPVWLDSQRRRDEHTLALALVIDCSGSMSGQKMELAKDAAKAAAEMLGPSDSIAVIGFSGEPERTVRMQSARNRVRILQNISRLTAQGGTAIFPALDAAFQDLLATSARVKHVILLTDGQTQEGGIPDLVQAMRAEAITVSSVGLGSDVNRSLLQQLANGGGGRAYFTDDPHNVPRIFVRETTTVSQNSAVEELVRVLPEEPADFLKGVDLAAAPLLRGYVATRPKPKPAQVVLRSDLGEPILARWRVGLGWVLAWTSDLKPRWAADLLRWRALPVFLGQLAREHMRERRHDDLPMRARIEDEELLVSVDAISADDRFLHDLTSTLTLEGPPRSDGPRERGTHALEQRAPGLFEARVPLTRYGSYTLRAVHRQGDRVIAHSQAQFSHPYSAEYAARPPDRALLERISATTGGGALPAPAVLFEPGDERVPAHEELWFRLLLSALGLFLLDLLLRRVRLFLPAPRA
jgi:Ca-activated chloride channel homolog